MECYYIEQCNDLLNDILNLPNSINSFHIYDVPNLVSIDHEDDFLENYIYEKSIAEPKDMHIFVINNDISRAY